MSDIFISYASEDRPRAKLLAEALQAQGWSVWWDRTIPFGKRYHQVIEDELAAASSVMVIWSVNSVESDWVRAEAGEGMARNVLVPVSIDDARPPLVFREIQTADLAGWQGEPAAPVFRKLLADLTALLGAPPEPSVEPLPAEEDEEEPAESEQAGLPAAPEPALPPAADRGGTGKLRRGWLWAAAALLVGLLAVWFLWAWFTPRGDSAPSVEKTPLPPEILLFEADPPAVERGQSTVLRWRSRNAGKAAISGIGGVSPSGEVTVEPDESTAYTLKVAGDDGAVVERSLDVEVVPRSAPEPAPDGDAPAEILEFRAEPERVPEGDRTVLRWRTENAEQVWLDGEPVEPEGAREVGPLRETALFRLDARGLDGREVHRRTRVVVEGGGGPGRSLELPAGRGADLDGCRLVSPDDPAADLTLASLSKDRLVLVPVHGAALALVSGVPGETECRGADLGRSRIPSGSLRAGRSLCVITNAKQLVRLEITQDVDRVGALVAECEILIRN